MSAGHAADFVRQLQESSGLQRELEAIQTDSRNGLIDEVARIASRAGFSVTREEVAAILIDESEISDAQLDDVVGGLSIGPLQQRLPTTLPGSDEPDHAYTVLGTAEIDGESYVVTRNPWGSS